MSFLVTLVATDQLSIASPMRNDMLRGSLETKRTPFWPDFLKVAVKQSVRKSEIFEVL